MCCNHGADPWQTCLGGGSADPQVGRTLGKGARSCPGGPRTRTCPGFPSSSSCPKGAGLFFALLLGGCDLNCQPGQEGWAFPSARAPLTARAAGSSDRSQAVPAPTCSLLGPAGWQDLSLRPRRGGAVCVQASGLAPVSALHLLSCTGTPLPLGLAGEAGRPSVVTPGGSFLLSASKLSQLQAFWATTWHCPTAETWLLKN